MTVARFVAGFLPKLAKILWNAKKKDIPVIAKVLSRSKLDTGGDVDYQARAEGAMRRVEVNRHSSIRLNATLGIKKGMKSGGHDWNTCK